MARHGKTLFLPEMSPHSGECITEGGAAFVIPGRAHNGPACLQAELCGEQGHGLRLRASVPHGHWKLTTLVAGLRTAGISAPYVFEGAINGQRFRAYVEQMLAPTLAPGDIVLLDNLRSHKVAGIAEAIAARE